MPVEPPSPPKIGPPVWIEWGKKIKEAIIANRPISGAGTLVSDAIGGRTVNSLGSGGGISESSHPFKVLQRNNGTAESPNWQWKVILESSLYKSERPNDKQTITGLDTWFEAIGNDAIWIGIVFDVDGVITSASIDSWGQGDMFSINKDAWSGENGYCEDDGGDPPAHQTTRRLIAYSVAGDGGQPILTQKLKSDLLIYDANEDGRPAKLVEEYSGGYPL